MAYCIHYKIEQYHRPQSREAKPTRQQTISGFVYIPYCNHPSGEFMLENIIHCSAPADKLKCQGNESKCQLGKGDILINIKEEG
jgi:hypothetical protein